MQDDILVKDVGTKIVTTSSKLDSDSLRVGMGIKGIQSPFQPEDMNSG